MSLLQNVKDIVCQHELNMSFILKHEMQVLRGENIGIHQMVPVMIFTHSHKC